MKPTSPDIDALIAHGGTRTGLYVGLLPTWGDKLTAPWGAGPRIFHVGRTGNRARIRTLYLGRAISNTRPTYPVDTWRRPSAESCGHLARHGSYPWEAGFTPDTDWTTAVARDGRRASAEGTQTDKALFAYHPQGGPLSSSQFLHNEAWLAHQYDAVGAWRRTRCSGLGTHSRATTDLKTGIKPTLDAEPNYEDHPVNPWPVYDPANGYFQ